MDPWLADRYAGVERDDAPWTAHRRWRPAAAPAPTPRGLAGRWERRRAALGETVRGGRVLSDRAARQVAWGVVLVMLLGVVGLLALGT